MQSDGYYAYRFSGPTVSQSFTKCSTPRTRSGVTNTGAKGQKG